MAVKPLPEQSLRHKRPRLSWEKSARFCWLSLLATVEVQLMLRCLDVRSRLSAARCNKQLYAAANHPFAWPQEQMATLRANNDVASLQSLGDRVRGSLLRLSSIHLRVLIQRMTGGPFCAEVFAVPNVHAITVRMEAIYHQSFD
jgi:hypothetical protein